MKKFHIKQKLEQRYPAKNVSVVKEEVISGFSLAPLYSSQQLRRIDMREEKYYRHNQDNLFKNPKRQYTKKLKIISQMVMV